MTSETDRLRADIERTREEVGDDVDALAEKVDPRRVAERRMESVRETATSVKEKVMGVTSSAEESVASKASDVARMPARTTRGNPMAVGVIAFGIGWLLGSVLPMGDKESRLARRAVSAAEPITEEAKRAAGEAADALREPAQHAAERLKESATASAETVKDAAGQAAPTMAPSGARDGLSS